MEPDAVQRQNKPLECRLISLGALWVGHRGHVTEKPMPSGNGASWRMTSDPQLKRRQTNWSV